MKCCPPLILVLLATAPGLAQAEQMQMKMPMAHIRAVTPAEKANKAAMATMMKNMAVKPSGDADKDFVSMMLPHHRGAVDMAKVELQFGKDPQLLALARAIVAAQETEIAEMKAWQDKSGGQDKSGK